MNRNSAFIFVFLLFSFLSGILRVSAQEKNVEFNLKSADYYKFINEDSCLYFANEAYRNALAANDLIAQGTALWHIAYVNRNKGNYETSLDLCRSIQEIAQRTSNKQLFAKALHTASVVYLEMGIFDMAYTNLTSAIKIYEDQNLPTATAALYNTLAVLYAKQANIEKAKQYIEKGLSLADTIDKRESILLNGNLALCMLYEQKSEEGERLLKKLIELIDKYNIPYNTAIIYQNLCRINIELQNYEQALRYGRLSLDFAQEHNNRVSMAQALYYIGNIFLTEGQYDTAIIHFKAVEQISTDLELLEIRLHTAGHLAYLYGQKHDFEQAYRYATIQNELIELFNEKSNRNDLYRLNLEYQYAQQALQIKEAGKKRNIILIVGGIVFVLLIALLWVLLSRQRFKLNNAKLKQQNTLLTLEQRNREITSKAIQMQQKDKAISDSIALLSQSKNGLNKAEKSVIDNVIKNLSLSIKENSWKEFEVRFEQVHTDFFKKLNERFPNLSPNEKRLCAYLKLSMTSKEIANLTHTTVGSVEQARFRLRKKLGLNTTDTELSSFIEKL